MGTDVLGVAIYSVPVVKASQVWQALQLLRQQLVMTELYHSCFAAREEEADDAMDTENTGVNPEGDASMALASGCEDRRLVEVSAIPPKTLFIHTPAHRKGTAANEASALALLCIEIHVTLGGTVTATLHMPEGMPAPSSNSYASAILNECRDVPLALSYILAE